MVHDDDDDKRSQKWEERRKVGFQILDSRRSPLHQQVQQGQGPRILPDGREEKGQGLAKQKKGG